MQFAKLIAQLLYTQPQLRPSILRALSTLITSSSTLSSSAAPSEELLAGFGIDQQDAAQNVQFLKSLATEMLAVLFNVFSSVPREQRGMVGDVVALWLSIMDEKVRTGFISCNSPAYLLTTVNLTGDHRDLPQGSNSLENGDCEAHTFGRS